MLRPALAALCVVLLAPSAAAQLVNSGATARPQLSSTDLVRSPGFRVSDVARHQRSGTAGDRTVRLVPGANFIPYQITIGERGDDACFLSIKSWSKPTPARDKRWRTTEHDACGSNGPTYSSAKTVRSWYGNASTGPRYTGFYGIRVGDNDRRANRLKMKGLQIYTARLDEGGDGAVTRTPSSAPRAVRFNNSRWHSAPICPNSKVVVGLDLHINSAVRSIVGVTPYCGRVTITAGMVQAPPPPPEPDPADEYRNWSR